MLEQLEAMGGDTNTPAMKIEKATLDLIQEESEQLKALLD